MSEATLWNKLKAKGFSDEAVAAIMGNMSAESNCIAYRVQGDFSTDFYKSIEYLGKVERGEITREQFAYNGPGGGGYGLCQWTYPTRKLGLYDLAVRKGASIGDEQIGVDWFYEELQQAEFSSTKNALTHENSIRDMVAVMLRNYEKPADQSDAAVAYRYNEAMRFYNKYHGSTPDIEPEPTPVPEPTGDSCEITVPVLTHGSKGIAVAMMQYGLLKNDISLGIYGADGDFGNATLRAVKLFQKQSNLEEDGVVGHDTWQVLFQ